MIIAIGASATRSTWLSSASPTSSLLPARAAPSSEAKSKFATASISDRAKSASVALYKWGLKTNGTAYSKDFFSKIDGLQGQDKVDAYTQAAMQVSADQGLSPDSLILVG